MIYAIQALNGQLVGNPNKGVDFTSRVEDALLMESKAVAKLTAKALGIQNALVRTVIIKGGRACL